MKRTPKILHQGNQVAGRTLMVSSLIDEGMALRQSPRSHLRTDGSTVGDTGMKKSVHSATRIYSDDA
jgi:hypothetical protein